MFSQFLGEDNMLAIVCKSYEAASRLEYYDEAGKIDHQQAVHGAAATLGINISRRFPVICLEDIRCRFLCLNLFSNVLRREY